MVSLDGSTVTSLPRSSLTKIKWSWGFRRPRHERLQAALAAFRQKKFAESTPSDLYQKAVDAALEEAQQFFENDALHGAWESLATARRLELLTLTREALEVRAAALDREAGQKLRGWRKETAASLLPSEPSDAGKPLDGAGKPRNAAQRRMGYSHFNDNELRARVWLVADLLDGASDNLYFKQEVTSHAISLLLALLLVLTTVSILVTTPTWPFPDLPADPKSRLLFPYVALFGALGACFSGLRSLLGPTTGAIPEVLLSSSATAIRPAIGAAAAIVIFLAQSAGLIDIAKGSVAGVLTVAFVAGFSEALVLRVVGSLETVKAKG